MGKSDEFVAQSSEGEFITTLTLTSPRGVPADPRLQARRADASFLSRGVEGHNNSSG